MAINDRSTSFAPLPSKLPKISPPTAVRYFDIKYWLFKILVNLTHRHVSVLAVRGFCEFILLLLFYFIFTTIL